MQVMPWQKKNQSHRMSKALHLYSNMKLIDPCRKTRRGALRRITFITLHTIIKKVFKMSKKQKRLTFVM